MRTKVPLAKFVLIISLLTAGPGASANDAPEYLPLTNAQRFESTGCIGGSAGCVADGSYDANTFAWNQFGECANTSLRINGNSVSEAVFVEATLNAVVNNQGDVIGGEFFLRGTIPGVGINQEQLLASGQLIDVFSGHQPGSSNIGALIELEFTVSPLSKLGSFLFWEANNDIGSWVYNLTHWQTTITQYSGNFTGSQYFFYNSEDIFAPDNDSDNDGFEDYEDNCIATNNGRQWDRDDDDIGNACDADLNNDCLVNAVDLGLFRSFSLTNNLSADFNGDYVVNEIDLNELRNRFFDPPGPSSFPNMCQ